MLIAIATCRDAWLHFRKPRSQLPVFEVSALSGRFVPSNGISPTWVDEVLLTQNGAPCCVLGRRPHNSTKMMPLCETTSAGGLVQLVACNLVPHGYWFYVTGRVPDGKDPAHVDTKLLKKYDAGLSRAARARRKQLGWANVRYLRHERFFVILATKGQHPFFEEEATAMRDLRHVPLRIGGYSISCPWRSAA